MFKSRSLKKELLDNLEIEPDLLYQNLIELNFINKYLGGHAISLCGIKKIITDKQKKYTIMDIGCGGGDTIKIMANWANLNHYNLNIIGVDLNKDCINYAVNQCKNKSLVSFKCQDFRVSFENEIKIDLVHASLFCHHFTQIEIVDFIKLCNKNKAIFIINDLERNPLAYYLISWLTKIFSKSPLVKNDAPLSVLRGFKKKEWLNILKEANANKFILKNKWAFRHLLIIFPNE